MPRSHGPTPIVGDGSDFVKRLAAPAKGPRIARYSASPAVYQDFVLITSDYNHDTICKLKITLRGAIKEWEQPYCSKVCSPVIYRDHVYWVWRKPVCLDFRTGKLRWTGPSRFGDAGSCIVTGDGRLILWAGSGELVLAETADRSPEKYTELARKAGIFRTDVWPHVVLAEGRLYCKDRRGNLKCFLLVKGRRED